MKSCERLNCTRHCGDWKSTKGGSKSQTYQVWKLTDFVDSWSARSSITTKFTKLCRSLKRALRPPKATSTKEAPPCSCPPRGRGVVCVRVCVCVCVCVCVFSEHGGHFTYNQLTMLTLQTLQTLQTLHTLYTSAPALWRGGVAPGESEGEGGGGGGGEQVVVETVRRTCSKQKQ